MGVNIQIVVGTYDKVLHGTIASAQGSSDVEFLDNFLFEAHTSAVRCLALSPSSSFLNASEHQKIILASGGSDERINLYHIAASPPPRTDEKAPFARSLAGKEILQSSKNRELGSLLHHSSAINALYFPTRSKLLSAADDNTIAVTRTRDWTVLSSIKAPTPKSQGRPSGDTAPLGGLPAGVNDFAVHPSMKLMISVGRGEKCMRLWNLVTGKKAGVLNFERSLLQGIGEGKWGSGEGRRVKWNTTGEEFLIAFEKGAALFGMDCKPRARIMPNPSTKIHQIRYTGIHKSDDVITELIAVSTEDGRVLIYATNVSKTTKHHLGPNDSVPTLEPIGQIGGDIKGRIKDFDILRACCNQGRTEQLYLVSANSHGAICVWALDRNDFSTDTTASPCASAESKGELELSKISAGEAEVSSLNVESTRKVGRLLGKYDTGHRITCLQAFLMSETSTKL